MYTKSFLNYFRLAIGSFVEEYNNKVQIVALDEEISEFSTKSTFDHPYPTTKIMWIPDSVSNYDIYVIIFAKSFYLICNVLERSISRFVSYKW